MANEKNDPEMSYRRGYQHGATQLYQAISNLLPPDAQKIVHDWVMLDVYKWRQAAIRGESGRGSKGLMQGEYPPTFRLGNLIRPDSN